MPGPKFTPKERVQVAMSHQEPDRVPVTEATINSPVAAKILGREAWVGYGGWFRGKVVAEMLMQGRRDELVRRHATDTLELYRALELDAILCGPTWSAHPSIPKEVAPNTWVYEDESTGLWFKYRYEPELDMCCQVDSSILQKGFPELERYVEALEAGEGVGASTSGGCALEDGRLDSIEYMAREAGDELYIIGGAWVAFPSYESWFTVFLEGLILEPDLIKRYMVATTKAAVKMAEAQIDAGVDAIFDGADWAGTSGPLCSPRHFREFVLPYMKALADACHRKRVPYIKHEDGNIMPVVDDFLVECGVDGYHPVEPAAGMDIGEIKARYGDRVVLLGNVDCGRVLVSGSQQEIVDAVKECIRAASPGGGHILTSSNSIYSHIPAENYLTMLRAAREYGSYPIRL